MNLKKKKFNKPIGVYLRSHVSVYRTIDPLFFFICQSIFKVLAALFATN